MGGGRVATRVAGERAVSWEDRSSPLRPRTPSPVVCSGSPGNATVPAGSGEASGGIKEVRGRCRCV